MKAQLSYIVLIGLGIGLTITGCQSPNGPDSAGSPTPDEYPPSSTAVCDPLGGGGSTGSLGAGQGLIANLAYLPNTNDPQYSSVFDFESEATQVPNPVYLSQLDVPTEYFEQGFTSANGTTLTTNSGQKLVQYFSLHIQSVLQLGPNDQDGDYQFAIASDDGSVVSVNDGSGMRILINNDGDHPTQLGCAQEAIPLDHTMQLPITVDYYQGPPYNIALILLWRQVNPQAQWCGSNDFGLDIPWELNDPYCGQNGNNLFFNWSTQSGVPSTPNANWNNLLARGWSVVPAQDYYLPGGTASNPCNTGNQCYTDTFTQPGQTATSEADLLFVTDTSPDSYDRDDIASALPDFSQQLPQGSSFALGTMLGVSSDSVWNGRLWHGPNVNPVLNSQSLSISDMQSLWGQDSQQLPNDTYSQQGELGLYSLSNSMQGTDLADNQSEGFYRSSASLGVVFLSDEPDQCSVDPNGLPECSGVTPASVLAQLQALKGSEPLAVDAIVRTTHCSQGPDYYGSGYLNLVQLAGGLSFDLDGNGQCQDNNSLYAQAMTAIGQQMAKQMEATGAGRLSDDFTLSHNDVNPSTISVSVNGSKTQYTYNSGDDQVDLQDAGTYGSVVQVNYCVGPSPSPSASPSPSPSASPSPSPSASPSPSPSASPSPSPSASPSPSPSASPSPSPSASPSPSPSASPSPSPSASPSPSPSASSCTGPFCGGGVLGQ